MTHHHPRMTRELKTVEAMIELYCRERHANGHGLCAECQALLGYARQCLQKCPFQEGKTTCARCPVHCYRRDMRAQIRAVMRYAGPRMLYRHPIMTVQHVMDGRRKEPGLKVSLKSSQKPGLPLRGRSLPE
jgi:hypothetical protein